MTTLAPLRTCRHGHTMLSDYHGCVTCVIEDNARMAAALRDALTVQPRNAATISGVVRAALESHRATMEDR
jgi:hypothetical protein